MLLSKSPRVVRPGDFPICGRRRFLISAVCQFSNYSVQPILSRELQSTHFRNESRCEIIYLETAPMCIWKMIADYSMRIVDKQFDQLGRKLEPTP